MSRRRGGFTLIELLVVISIIAVLAALIFPTFAQAKAMANATRCLNNLKQFGSAFAMYQGDWEGKYPYTALPAHASNDTIGESCVNNPVGTGPWYRRAEELWTAKLEPYVGYPLIYRVSATRTSAQGIMNCRGMETKAWKVHPTPGTPDDAGYGYNFLYLGLPFRPIAQDPPPEDDASYNPYAAIGKGEFFAGAARQSSVKSPGETICLVENAFIWAFPPYQSPATRWTSGNAYIRPRHINGLRTNVLWCDGHVSAMQTRQLVAMRSAKGPVYFGDGSISPSDSSRRGIARDNSLWDLF